MHLSNVFKEHGYETVLCGFEHEMQDFRSAGFEKSIHGTGEKDNGWKELAGVGKDIADWFSCRDKDRPFYLQIGCNETHRDWELYAEKNSERGIWKAPYLIEDPELDEEMAYFQGSIEKLDQGVGEILDELQSYEGLDNTIMVFTTDHGIDFPQAKGTMFDPGIGVYLFMAYLAGRWKEGAKTSVMTSHLDIYPTILEACNIEINEKLPVHSLVPILKGDDITCGRECVNFEKTYHDNYDPIRGVRTERYKYVINFDAQVLYDVRLLTAPRYRWFRFPYLKSEREELYYLLSDPDESLNLAKREEYKEIRDKLRRNVAHHMKETNDPLLEGPMTSPYYRKVRAEMFELSEK